MATLTKHDLDVLEKIKDPESGPSNPLLIDDSLPKDPHITDPSTYQGIAQRERDIILLMQDVELQIAGLKPVAELSPLDTEASEATIKLASFNALSDLDRAISLLAPKTPWASISTQAAKTLSQALTQRGALYHLSAKQLSFDTEASVRIDERRREAKWRTIDFEEAASRDFMTGGRYGNEIAKALAVSANPTAKLCGDMVRQAMKREMGGGGS